MIRVRESAPPLDFSFKNLDDIENLHMLKPRRGVKRYHRTSSGRFSCTSLRLNNNHLTTVHGIHAVTYQVQQTRQKSVDVVFVKHCTSH